MTIELTELEMVMAEAALRFYLSHNNFRGSKLDAYKILEKKFVSPRRASVLPPSNEKSGAHPRI